MITCPWCAQTFKRIGKHLRTCERGPSEEERTRVLAEMKKVWLHVSPAPEPPDVDDEVVTQQDIKDGLLRAIVYQRSLLRWLEDIFNKI